MNITKTPQQKLSKTAKLNVPLCEKKNFSKKPKKSQARTWAQENKTRRSIFTADLSKADRNF